MDYDYSKPHEECGVFGIYTDGGVNPPMPLITGFWLCSTGARKAAELQSATAV